MSDCFSEADIVLANEDFVSSINNKVFQKLEGRVVQYLELAENPLIRRQPIRNQEAIMAMAYAASQQSSCLQRKVGAVIVDEYGNVISSGFNEVPMYEQPCKDEHLQCARKKARTDFLEALTAVLPQNGIDGATLDRLFRQHFRILDRCRSLHAEENAIISLARNGHSTPLEKCTLYTTTYPCRMCANKIVNIGVKHIVYLEPYPDLEAKTILGSAGVRDEFFEGVTFKAYFRIYGDEK